VVTAKDALDLGFSGVMLRGSGFEWDLRRVQPYEIYDQIDFSVPVEKWRLLRPLFNTNNRNETVFKIISQCLDNPQGLSKTNDTKLAPPTKTELKQSMEALIHHFKIYTSGITIPTNETYVGTEAPKGEFGV
jgi:NADH:ubiquinone oxidoreductase subunit D